MNNSVILNVGEEQREKADDSRVQDEIEVSRRPDVVNTII